MASIHQEITVAARAAHVWESLRDVANVHKRVVPGFLTDCRMEGEARVVTFFNGMVAKELIVDLDDDARRLVWSVVEGRMSHHNGSIQVFADGEGCRLVWIADILPHELAKPVGGMMQQGMDAMKKKLEADTAVPAE